MTFALGFRNFRGQFALLAAVTLPLMTATFSNGQGLNDQDIIFSEVFEEIFVFDPASGAVNDVLDSNPLESPFGQLVEAVTADRIVISDFGNLYEYVDQTTTRLVASLPRSISAVARDGNGNLFVGDSNGIFSVDLDTGEVESVIEELFFTTDIVASGDGLVYFTSVLGDVLAVIDPITGTSRQIGRFGFGEPGFEEFGAVGFRHLDIGPDGLLYAASLDEVFQVNPLTGDAQILATTGISSIDGLSVDLGGQLVLAGDFGGTEGIFSVNPLTGGVTTLLDGATIDDRFFSIQDISVWEPGLRTALNGAAVPEPTGLVPMLIVSGVVVTGRRRSLGCF